MGRLLCRVAGTLGVAVMLFAVACSEEGTAPANPGEISLILISPPNPTGEVGQELADPLIVQAVANPDCAPQPNTCIGVPNVTVQWKVLEGDGEGDGTLFVENSSTDANGEAYNFWTLGTSTSEPQVVEARAIVQGQKQQLGTFTATAVAGPPTTIQTDGDNQKARHDEAVQGPLSITLLDEFGNLVEGIPVSFRVGSGAGRLENPPGTFRLTIDVTTDANGTASLDPTTTGSWILNSFPCENALTATVDLMSQGVIFSATARDCWSSRRGLNIRRSLLGAGEVNGLLYAIGGQSSNFITNTFVFTNTLEAYTPMLDRWDIRFPVPFLFIPPGAAVGVLNGLIYAVGGCHVTTAASLCPQGEALSVVRAYNPQTNAWLTKASLPVELSNLAAGIVGGKLYAVGGRLLDGSFSSAVYEFDPAANGGLGSWSTRAPMAQGRAGLAVGVIGNFLYAVGGVGPGLVALPTAERYDPTGPTNTWQPIQSMSFSRVNLAAGVVGTDLYAVGGSSFCANDPCDATASNAVEMFDGTQWVSATVAQMPFGGRLGLAIGVVDGVIYAMGGSFSGAAADITNRVQVYYP